MSRYLKKTGLFLVLALAMTASIYWGRVHQLNKTKPGTRLYIWGDSQTFQGFAPPALDGPTKMKTVSTAKHGAGVYDMLVFANQVPKNSTVILGYSIPALMRTKDTDNNLSNISPALFTLWRLGYSFSDIKSIFNKNIVPRRIYRKNHNLYNQYFGNYLSCNFAKIEDLM